MLLNKTYIVSGVSSGIGKAIAELLLSLEANVIGIGRNAELISGQDRFSVIKVDFSTPKSYEALLKSRMQNISNIDGCICAAGVGRFGALEQFSFAQMQSMMHINFMAHAWLLRCVLPRLKKQKSGDVVIIGSEASIGAGKNGAMYCASKFALRGLAQSLREECSKRGVRINLINPGMVKTPFFDDLSFSPGDDVDNYLTPEDVAKAVRLILTSPSSVVFDEINLSPLKKVINFNP